MKRSGGLKALEKLRETEEAVRGSQGFRNTRRNTEEVVRAKA